MTSISSPASKYYGCFCPVSVCHITHIHVSRSNINFEIHDC